MEAQVSNFPPGVMCLQEWDEEPLPFGPVVDAWRGDDAFLPDEPHHLIRHGKFLQIPWMVGTNKNDGAFRVQGRASFTASMQMTWVFN